MRIQNSAFEGQAGQTGWMQLQERLLREIKTDGGSLRIYFCSWRKPPGAGLSIGARTNWWTFELQSLLASLRGLQCWAGTHEFALPPEGNASLSFINNSTSQPERCSRAAKSLGRSQNAESRALRLRERGGDWILPPPIRSAFPQVAVPSRMPTPGKFDRLLGGL